MLTRTPKRDIHELLRWLSAQDAEPAGAAVNELFEGCFELSEAVRQLERAAGRPGSSAATAAALGTLADTFEGLATAVITLGEEFVASAPQPVAESEEIGELRVSLHGAATQSRLAGARVTRARALTESLTTGT